jgi:lipopolysaccharide transport system permease protein
MAAVAHELTLKPRSGWQAVDLADLWFYRELLGFLIWRDLKIRYKQTALGGIWALIQPLIGMMVFGMVLTRVTNISVQGPPYPLFVFAGLIPWTFFANSLSIAGNSLVGSEQMIRKIYFPRVLVPLAAISALLVDMLVSMGFLAILMLIFRWPITPALLTLPLFVVGTLFATAGISLFLAALNVQYRDVKYIVPFFTQMALFMTPVIYPLTRLSPGMRNLFALNPMAGMVEGFRFAVLGTPVMWPVVWYSLFISAALLSGGLFFFKRVERSFADLI